MFNIDERLKGLPAVKEQVVQLFQSLNQPHLAVPGRRAGPAMCWVLGLRGPSGFAVFVYLYIPDSGECAVYVPASGTVGADRYQAEETEALGFVESMGFMMDNLNFRARPAEEQDQMMRTFPVFMREPPPAGTFGVSAAPPSAPTRAPTGNTAGVAALGKLFAAFSIAALCSCAHVASEKDREQAKFHYDLGAQAMVRSPQESFREAEAALALDPQSADAWHLKGILLHTAFGRLDEARAAYVKALELKQPFSEAHTNLGNLYMDLKRFDDAIREYEVALNDVLYTAPYIAQGNMGWAYFRKGDAKSALGHLKAAVTMNPKYCLGFLQLGQVYDGQGETQDACKYFGKYREACPDQADAYHREGMCQAKLGNREVALKAFETCATKAKNDDQKEQCQKLKEQLPP